MLAIFVLQYCYRLEEFDEESPLGGSGEHRSSQDGDSNESPPPETVTGKECNNRCVL